MNTMKAAAKSWADGNAEGRALCDEELGDMCYIGDAPRAVRLIADMAQRMDAGDAVAVGWMYQLAARAI